MTEANENLTEKIISCHSPLYSLGEKLQPHSIQRIIRCFISSFIPKESCLVEGLPVVLKNAKGNIKIILRERCIRGFLRGEGEWRYYNSSFFFCEGFMQLDCRPIRMQSLGSTKWESLESDLRLLC